MHATQEVANDMAGICHVIYVACVVLRHFYDTGNRPKEGYAAEVTEFLGKNRLSPEHKLREPRITNVG